MIPEIDKTFMPLHARVIADLISGDLFVDVELSTDLLLHPTNSTDVIKKANMGLDLMV